MPTRSKRRKVWDTAEILALGVVTDLTTAGEILDTGRSKSYSLTRAGEFPVPVFRVGKTYKVRVADIIALLGLRQTD